ncbi:MAG TPA: hypothetical protein VL983_10335 [Terriglobales bacterium]|nr:hypothetical protein [Terriglobales bacterium]
MTGIIVFNLLMVAFAAAIALRLLPPARVSTSLDWLHGIIGITPPAADKAWIFALVWVVSLLLIVDGLLLMLVFLVSRVM